MSLESDFYSVLSSASGLTTLVSDRIVPSHAGDGTSAPYVVYTTIFGEAIYSLSGAGEMSRVRMQVDCYAEDPDTAMAIALAVIDAVPETGALCRAAHSNQDLGMEADTRLYRRMVEMSIFRRSS
jgi:hypothetical protein